MQIESIDAQCRNVGNLMSPFIRRNYVQSNYTHTSCFHEKIFNLEKICRFSTLWDAPSFLFSVILWLTYFRIVYSNLLSTLKNEFGNLDLYNFYWKMEDISSVNVAFFRMYLFAHFQILRGSLYKRYLQTFLSIGTYLLSPP